MTVLECFLIALGCISMAFVAFVVGTDTRRGARERKALDDRAAELDTYRESTMEMLSGFAEIATKLSTRETDELRLTLEVLVSDRERMLTALLAARTEARPAMTVGRVDEALARAAHPPRHVGDLLEESLRERQAANEFNDERGEAITPVGM